MLSIAQALLMEPLSTATVVAGRGGLDKPIQWVHMVDIPEMAEWSREGELVLTTAFGLKDNPELQHTLIPRLVDVGVSGMIVSIGRYFYDIPEIMIQQANELDFPLLTLPWEVPFTEVNRFISEHIVQERYALMQQSVRVHNTLTEVVLKGADLDELARALTALVKCPVNIEDTSFRVLAYATYGEVDPAREESILRRQAPPTLMAELARQGLLTQIQQSLHPIYIPPVPEHGMTFERLVAPIIAGAERLGYVWLLARDRLTGEMDMVTIEHAATVAALILLRERAVYETEQRLKRSLLDELLQSPGHLNTDLTERLRSLGLGYKLQIIVIRRRETVSNNRLPLSQSVTEQLSLLGRRGITVERGEDLVVLLESDCTEIGVSLANAVWTAVDRQACTLSLGVGRATQDLSQLSASYEEAIEATEIGMILQPKDGGVFPFSTLGVLSWLRHLPHETRARNSFHQALQVVAEYDTEHCSHLLGTLETFLDVGCNRQQTAKRLYVHRNTLTQRLSKIQSLTQLDLRDPQILLNLNIALKAWRLAG